MLPPSEDINSHVLYIAHPCIRSTEGVQTRCFLPRQNLCGANLSLSCSGCFHRQPWRSGGQAGRRLGATLPPCGFYRGESSAPLAAARLLLPAGVTLSNAVSQSLARSRSLSICQSAVSHCFIQSPPPPPPLSLSVWRSFTARRASLLICTPHFLPRSLTCTIPDIHHGGARLRVARVFSRRNFLLGIFFFLLFPSRSWKLFFSPQKKKKKRNPS